MNNIYAKYFNVTWNMTLNYKIESSLLMRKSPARDCSIISLVVLQLIKKIKIFRKFFFSIKHDFLKNKENRFKALKISGLFLKLSCRTFNHLKDNSRFLPFHLHYKSK